MINAEFKTDAKTLTLNVTGHAEYAEYGKDIVCSAASILFTTLKSLVGDTSDGTSVTCDNTDNFSSFFVFTQSGFQLLADAYPDCVAVMVDKA